MKRIVSPDCNTRSIKPAGGPVRLILAAASRYFALLRLSLLHVIVLAGMITVLHGAQFTLNWSDNSNNESGFRIERSADGASYVEIASVGANVVSYVDAGLPNSTNYWYRLRAYNAAGNSGYSNVASGTTPPQASNNAPSISDVANQSISTGGNTGALAFTVADSETAAGSLVVSGISSNTTLVPNANIVFGGSGSSRTVTVTAANGQAGSATVTITVSDGSLTASDSFVVTVLGGGSTVVNISSGWVNTALPSVQTGQFTIEFDATPSANPIDGVISLSTAAVGAYADMAVIVRFNSSGQIDARNGADYAASQTLNYAGGTTYRFRLVVDVVSHAYSTYVTAPGGSETLLGSNYAFRTEQSAISSLGYWNVRVSDTGTLTVGPVTVTPSATNTAPTVSDVTNRTINEDGTTGAVAFTVGDAQTSAGSLTLSGNSSNTALVPNASIVFGGSGSSRTVTVTPSANQSGTATITVTVSDGSLTATDTFMLTVSAVNDAPTIGNIANRTINEDTNTGAVSFTVGDVETSTGSLTLSGSSSNTTLVPNAAIVFGGSGSSRTVTVTPAANQSGTATITVTVSDGSLSATDTFVLTVSAVNDAPSMSDISNQTINAGSSTNALAFTIGDAETAATSLTLSASSSNTVLVPVANLAFGGSGANRTVTVTPVAGQSGTATLTVTVSDGFLTASDSFVLTVNSVNTAPTITDIANQTVNEDNATGSLAFTIGDGETAAGSLTVSATSSNTTLVPNASVTLGGSGSSRTVTVTPAANQTGTTTVTVTVSDGSLTTSDTFTVTVNAVNDVPTISNIADQSISSGTSTSALAFTIADVETAAGSLTVSGASSNTTLVPNANIAFGGSGGSRTVTVTPAAGQSGTATITVTVSDGTASASDTFVLTVTLTNTTPTITDISNQTVNEDNATGAIAFTIGDTQTSPGSLTLSAASSNTTLVPTSAIVLGGSGSSRTVTVTPAANQNGTATITIAVSDGSLTASDSFVLTVSAVNDAPTISNIADRSISQGTNTSAIAFTVGDNETAAGSLTLSGSSSNTTLVPNSAIVFGGSGANRTVTITPAAGQSGTATLTVTVGDGSTTAADSFVLTVTSTDVAPTITTQPAAVTAVAGTPASFSVVASGTPAPTYQWRLNGSAIAGATGATYSISSAQASHAGTYTVVVSNSAGSVTSAGATLTVNAAIAITTQPASQTIARNTRATLTVGATGSGLTYQWYVGASGDTSAAVSGATSATYTTPKLTESRNYWVRVAATGQSVDSATAAIAVSNTTRFGSGSIRKNRGTTEPLPLAVGEAVADGTFAIMIAPDGTIQMLGFDSQSGLAIDAGGAIDENGGFTFAVAGFGTVTGQVIDGVITASITGTEITFSGVEEPVLGVTRPLGGWYQGAILNSSDGEVVVLAGPTGSAYVMTFSQGQISGGLVTLGLDGTISTTMTNGSALDLAINGISGRMTGTLVAAGTSRRISGNRSDIAADKRLVNTSVRAQVRQGDGLMVAGFVVGGTGSKRVLVRAVGPTLGSFGVGGVLADPVITVFRQGNATPIAQNDNWSSAANAAEIAATTAAVGGFALPAGSRDAAVLIDLPAGAYTAQVSGVGGATGMAIVEVYDADAASGSASIPAQLANISMRGVAGNGDDLVVAGFVVTGNAPKQVLIRAVGPELAAFGVGGAATDPVLTVFERVGGQEAQIASNNDWGVDAAAVSAAGGTVGAFGLTPGSRSAAMVIWLDPGVYTAQASSNNGSSGIAIVEVYEIR